MLFAEEVFARWDVETLMEYIREQSMDIDLFQVEALLEQVSAPPVAFVFTDTIEQDPPVPYWSRKDVGEDLKIHAEDGVDAFATLALRDDQMCEFLASLFDSIEIY